MGHAELLHKIESLPAAQREVVERLVDTLSAVPDVVQGAAALEDALAAARGSWPRKMTMAEIDADIAAMRAEWDGRA